jgi:hypothetical protein
MALPSLSTAMQNDVVGHDTALSGVPGSMLVAPLQLLPSKIKARPTLSTAAQKALDAQDTDSSREPPTPSEGSIVAGLLHMPLRSIDTRPPASTATQKADETHEIAEPLKVSSTSSGFPQVSGSAALAAGLSALNAISTRKLGRIRRRAALCRPVRRMPGRNPLVVSFWKHELFLSIDNERNVHDRCAARSLAETSLGISGRPPAGRATVLLWPQTGPAPAGKLRARQRQ